MEYSTMVAEAIRKRLGYGARQEKGYQHAAFVFRDSSPVRHLAYGANIYPPHMSHSTLHAEECAISKLRPRKKGTAHHLKVVSICVLRVSNTGKLGSSRPCAHCVRLMAEQAPRMGYRINWVYFSTSEGKIDRIKLSQLQKLSDLHTSAFFRKDRPVP